MISELNFLLVLDFYFYLGEKLILIISRMEKLCPLWCKTLPELADHCQGNQNVRLIFLFFIYLLIFLRSDLGYWKVSENILHSQFRKIKMGSKTLPTQQWIVTKKIKFIFLGNAIVAEFFSSLLSWYKISMLIFSLMAFHI